MRYWPNGLGESLGDVLCTASPAYISGNTWFVNSATGTDGVSPAGQDKELPLATLLQAVTNSADGDVVVLASGHTEALGPATTLTVNKRIVIVGAGTVDGKPAASIVPNYASIVNMVNVTVTAEIRNVRFRENIGSAAIIDIRAIAASCRFIGCYFDMGGQHFDGLSIQATAAARTRVERCTFKSTATSASLLPRAGLNFAAGLPTDVEIIDCTFDDGTYGYSSGSLVTAATARLRVINPTFLNGADMTQAGTPTASYIAGLVQAGSGKVDF